MSKKNQLYYGEIKLHFNDVRFVQGQQAELDFYSASSLKQLSAVDMSLHSETRTYCIIFCLTRLWLQPRTTALESNTPTITPSCVDLRWEVIVRFDISEIVDLHCFNFSLRNYF